MLFNLESAHKVAGVVTLYNSEPEVVRRIGTYVYQLGKLYVVDNSECTDQKLVSVILESYSNIEYINVGSNEGIAHALNIAATSAINDGFSFLLMMDDDSETPSYLVESLFKGISHSQKNEIGIVCAQTDIDTKRDKAEDVLTTITSGSILNLRAYDRVGPFQNDLFIDWVDHEYCFRLRENGYRVIMLNGIRIKHRLGIFREKNVFSLFSIRWRSHSPTRLYYKFRNSLYVMHKYKDQLPSLFKLSVYYELLENFFKVLIFETNKKVYISFMKRGIIDAYNRRLGKIS